MSDKTLEELLKQLKQAEKEYEEKVSKFEPKKEEVNKENTK